MTNTYQYQIQPLPAINIIGGDFTTAGQIANVPIPSGYQLPTSSPPVSNGGGSGGGTPSATVDLDLCGGITVRVYGFVL